MARAEPELFRPGSIAERTNLWRVTAHVYEPLWRRFSTGILTRGKWTLQEEFDLVCRLLQPKNKGIYLDIGSSTGVYARAIVAANPESTVVLIDYSRPMLRKAQKKLGNNKRAVFLLCNAEHLPLPDNSVDGAVMGGTLNEMTEPRLVLRELERVMKKGAIAVVMHLVRHREKRSLLQKILAGGGVWFPLPGEADALFQEAGFETMQSGIAGIMRVSRLHKPG